MGFFVMVSEVRRGGDEMRDVDDIFSREQEGFGGELDSKEGKGRKKNIIYTYCTRNILLCDSYFQSIRKNTYTYGHFRLAWPLRRLL